MNKSSLKEKLERKAAAKSERKEAIKRANTPATGPVVGPGKFPLVAAPCKYCGYPTTEVWVLKTGEVGCSRCVAEPSDVVLARVLEARGPFVVAHTVTPTLA